MTETKKDRRRKRGGILAVLGGLSLTGWAVLAGSCTVAIALALSAVTILTPPAHAPTTPKAAATAPEAAPRPPAPAPAPTLSHPHRAVAVRPAAPAVDQTPSATPAPAAVDPGWALSTSSAGPFTEGDLDISRSIGPLNQGIHVLIPLYARSTSGADETLAAAELVTSGGIFAGSDPASATWSTGDPAGTALPASGAPIYLGSVLFTTATDWPIAYQGETGRLSVELDVR